MFFLHIQIGGQKNHHKHVLIVKYNINQKYGSLTQGTILHSTKHVMRVTRHCVYLSLSYLYDLN